MDEDDVNIWYDDEKQKVLELYEKDLEDNKDKAKSEEQFHKRMKKTHEKYIHRMEKAIKSKARREQFQKKVKLLKQKYHLEKKKDEQQEQ